MTIRFAAAKNRERFLNPLRARSAIGLAANDNGGSVSADAMLNAALRHFAEHGLAAADRARREAEAAFFAGDREAYQWWLEICRTLDRAMARDLDAAVPARK